MLIEERQDVLAEVEAAVFGQDTPDTQPGDDLYELMAQVGLTQERLNGIATGPFPQATFDRLCATIPDFMGKWEHTLPNPQDNSTSGYDMALARRMAKAGVSVEDQVAILLAHTRKWNPNQSGPKHVTYYQRTLVRSRKALTEDARQAAEELALESAREAIAAALEKRSAQAIFDVVPQLALLPDGEFMDWLKEAKGLVSQLDKNKLKSAVGNARKTWIQGQERRVSADENPSDLPVIFVDANCPLRDKGRDVVEALKQANQPPDMTLYCCGSEIIELTKNSEGEPIFANVGKDRLMAIIADACDTIGESRKGMVHVAPPDEIVSYVYEQRDLPFKQCKGIARMPLVRPDGSIAAKSGYDEATKRLIRLLKGFDLPPIPSNPTKDEVTQALDTFNEPYRDFDIDCPANIHAMRLSVMLEPVYNARSPLGIIDAGNPSSGKSLLASALGYEILGGEPGFFSEPQTEEEWRKEIATAMLEGPSLLIMDNIDNMLKSGVFANALTNKLLRIRNLGRFKLLAIPHPAVWLATGNNIKLGGDIPRRTYGVRLGKREKDYPFAHYPLLPWLRAELGKLTYAKLVLWNAYRAAGCPQCDGPSLASFEEWSAVMRNFLAFLEIDGFLANQSKRLADSDAESAEWVLYLNAVSMTFGDNGFTASDVTKIESLRYCLPSEIATRISGNKDTLANVLGIQFSQRNGREHGEERIRIEKLVSQYRDHAQLYVIRKGPRQPGV